MYPVYIHELLYYWSPKTITKEKGVVMRPLQLFLTTPTSIFYGNSRGGPFFK